MKNAFSESPLVTVAEPEIDATIQYIMDEVQRLGLYPIIVDYVDSDFSFIALLDAFVSSLAPMMKKSVRLRVGMRKVLIRSRLPGFAITISEIDSLLKECYQAAAAEMGNRIAIIFYIPQVLPTYNAWEFAQGFYYLIRRVQCPWITVTASPVLSIYMGDSRALMLPAGEPPGVIDKIPVLRIPFLMRYETKQLASKELLGIYDIDDRRLMHTGEAFPLEHFAAVYPDHYTIGRGHIVASFGSTVQTAAHETWNGELRDCGGWKDIAACWGDLPEESFSAFKTASSDLSGPFSVFTLRLCGEDQEQKSILSHFGFIPTRSIVRLQICCEKPFKELVLVTPYSRFPVVSV